MKMIVQAIAALALVHASYATAGERPKKPSEDPNILFQVEVPGHLADGVHEIVTVVQDGPSVSVFKADGTYNWPSQQPGLSYKEAVIFSDLRCLLPSGGTLGIICSRDNRPADGLLEKLTILCDGEEGLCTVTKFTAWYDRINGRPSSKTEVLLNGAYVSR